jgi:Fe-S-cluster-containing dehydrogenase component/formate-dependent nitrite reductase membrane component NrfD
VRYGFVIDQRVCIGCHACTVACKEENQVPLGAFRTWVKYVERGQFPSTRRYFAVLRCNHCDNAPCVTICPTVALHRRGDGIVDLDGARCIGCKSCMHACPYDALYIDPDTRTAAKCHYCAHRVEVGLEPACVIVCPEQAIIAGDLDDPASRIARLVATEGVQVRKPEQGTQPKVYYLGADTSALTPVLQRPAEGLVWAERPADQISLVRMAAEARGASRMGGEASRPVYDVPRAPRPWGGRVAAYLWTKAIAAGTLLVAGLAALAGAGLDPALAGVVAPAVALGFLAVTAALLVLDLKRPDRFHYILLRPNPRSWLVKGTWILIAYGVAAALWLLASVVGGGVPGRWAAALVVVLAGATAGYSAWLFGQAEGRDFWQSPMLLPQLLLSALAAGAAVLILGGSMLGVGNPGALAATLALALGLKGLALLAELFGGHAGADAAQAARLLTRGALARWFWWGVIGAGMLVPILLLLIAGPALAPLAATLALAGLWVYEDLWLRAGQVIPLS